MKQKLLIVILCAFAGLCSISAQNKTYKNDQARLSFTYPAILRQAKINNAPHMLLKLEDGSVEIDLSFWSYGLDPSYSIWDEEFVQMSKENLLRFPGASLVSVDKRNIATQTSNKRCLVLIGNLKKHGSHTVTYQFLHHGNLVQVVVAGKGNYSASYLTKYNGYIKGLKLQ